MAARDWIGLLGIDTNCCLLAPPALLLVTASGLGWGLPLLERVRIISHEVVLLFLQPLGEKPEQLSGGEEVVVGLV